MSQHDYDIADQTAPNVRGDINLALKALASTSSGATAPATTYANMLWYDTASNLLKKRNEANSGWITLGTLDDGASTFTPTLGDNLVDEDSMSSNSAVKVPSQQSVKAYVDNSITAIPGGIGVDQTWQSVTRTSGTIYQNTTGRPIMISASCAGNYNSLFVGVSSPPTVRIAYNNASGTGPYEQYLISSVIPSGNYYQLFGNISEVAELR